MIDVENRAGIEDWDESDDEDYCKEEDEVCDEPMSPQENSLLIGNSDIHEADSFKDMSQVHAWKPEGIYELSQNEHELTRELISEEHSFHNTHLQDELDILEEDLLNRYQ